MWVPANTIASMPKGREDNTHLNVYGARVIAGITVDAIAKAVPELESMFAIMISWWHKYGSGDFFTVQGSH